MSGRDEKPDIRTKPSWLDIQNREMNEEMKLDIWKLFKTYIWVNIFCFLINIISGIILFLRGEVGWLIIFPFAIFFLLLIANDYRKMKKKKRLIDEMFPLRRVVIT